MTKPATLGELRRTIGRNPKRRARVDELKREMYGQIALNELRRKLDMTQEQVAELMGVTQESVSQMERRNEILLSSLVKYVQALGGTVEVIAHVGQQKVELLTALRERDRREAAETGLDA